MRHASLTLKRFVARAFWYAFLASNEVFETERLPSIVISCDGLNTELEDLTIREETQPWLTFITRAAQQYLKLTFISGRLGQHNMKYISCYIQSLQSSSVRRFPNCGLGIVFASRSRSVRDLDSWGSQSTILRIKISQDSWAVRDQQRTPYLFYVFYYFGVFSRFFV